jgi:DNA/RNA-binding domain of Phe-tRNA-synthetase-like protein
MTTFQYQPAIFTRNPDLIGGVIIGRGVKNGATPPELQQLFFAEQAEIKKRLGDVALSQLPSIAAWRQAFSRFGVEPTKYRSAAEALLRRLTKKGDIPSINTLVDIGNLLSVRYALPVAVIDTQNVQGAITVHYADGTETYTILGQAELDHPEAGEVVFSDEAKQVMARRWCWRQSEESAAQDTTTEVVITAEAHHSGARPEVEALVKDFLELLQKYCGGDYEWKILDSANLVFTRE